MLPWIAAIDPVITNCKMMASQFVALNVIHVRGGNKV